MFAVKTVSAGRAIVTGSGGTVMTTGDAGETWHIQRLPRVDWARRFSFISEHQGWLIGNWYDLTDRTGNGSKLFRTDDGGRDWQELPLALGIDPTVYFLADLAFVNSRTAFLVAAPFTASPQEQDRYPGLVFVTRDGGAHWERLELGIERKINQVVFLDSARGFALSQPYYSTSDFDSSSLHRTEDGGRTWSMLGGRGFGRLRFVDGRVGWAGNYRTTDGGASWQYRSFGASPLGEALETVRFVDSLTGYALSQGTVLKTADAGASWTPQLLTEQYLTDLDFHDARTGYACGYGGVVYRTRDGGATWLRTGQGATADLEDVEFVDARWGWAVGFSGTILHTSDGGARWTPQELPAEARTVTLRGVDFLDARRGWVAGGAFVLKTEDGGSSWRVQLTHPMPDPTGRFRDVAFLDDQVGVAVGQEYSLGPGILYRTTDGGASWQRQDGGTLPALDQISFCSATSGWICGQDVVLRTSDRGATWEQTHRFTGQFLRYAHFADCQHGWLSALDQGGFYRTVDGGSSWQSVPYEHRFNQLLSSFCFLDGQRGIASTFLFSNILSSEDGGLHWSYQERLPTARLNAMAFVNDSLGWAVGTQGAILRFRGSYFGVHNRGPGETALAGTYPNPFKEETTIFFHLSQAQDVTVSVHDILGRVLDTPMLVHAPQGSSELRWRPRNIASGVCLVQIRCRDFTRVIKGLFLK